MKVLIVEDEARLGRMLKQSLSEHAHIVNWVSTCGAANDAIVETSYDLIVVDLGLPDGDGIALVRDWRECGFTEPILILSARDSREDRVRGLDVGADDYLPKPFGMDELLARMRALLRRQAARKQTIYEHNGITLDLLAHVVKVGDQQLDLTAREYALMTIFVQNAGRVLTRSLIAEKIWDSHFDVDTNLIDVYMSRLRAKVGNASGKPMFKTIRGIGYQLL
jgi:DNA-binding response OmpR family regulator